jgi:hypothetical protein
MPLFGTTGDSYEKNKKRIKELKGSKEKGDKKERRQIKRMNRRERENVLNAAAKGKVSEIIDKTGRIIGVEAVKKVPEYSRRLRNGKCIYCGTAADRKGYIHEQCKSLISDMPSANEINRTNYSRNLGKGIPDGQNMNGRMECINKHVAMYYEVEGKYNCSRGCNG